MNDMPRPKMPDGQEHFTASSTPTRNPGSFRDPNGHVWHLDGRVLRVVDEDAAQTLSALLEQDFLQNQMAIGNVVRTAAVKDDTLAALFPGKRIFEHSNIPFISHPYEWTFGMLKQAALLQLNLLIDALEHNLTLIDATAYNIQFVGAKPIFIDLLSFQPYREGQFWLGYRQFSEQFLNPLLLASNYSIPIQHWYRGSLEGISSISTAQLLPLRRKLSLSALSHVVLPARVQKKAVAAIDSHVRSPTIHNRRLSRRAYQGILVQLRDWIASLKSAVSGDSVWTNYTSFHTYSSADGASKRDAVSGFVEKWAPGLVLDLGCNTGEYSVAALKSGAGYVVGAEFDSDAAEKAFSMASAESLAFLPIVLDAANPSPDQGWDDAERAGFRTRANFDMLIALAVEHHLAIGRNVPLDGVVDWMVSLAPRGVIEFVPKNDTTVQAMLANRQDIFPDYTEEAFRSALAKRARIEASVPVSREGRVLFAFDRTN
jgi:ribosomal protein L11 methylase PrmA